IDPYHGTYLLPHLAPISAFLTNTDRSAVVRLSKYPPWQADVRLNLSRKLALQDLGAMIIIEITAICRTLSNLSKTRVFKGQEEKTVRPPFLRPAFS
ncbi:MAG: hypothetical protein ACRERU_05040, partial [Methylococcales bacterium]